MTIGGRPPADIVVDAVLVRRLLEEQHPDLASLPLLEVGEGWDNRMFRLGEALAVRLPRRVASAPLIDQEQRWLPELAKRLPLPVPAPVRTGRPGPRFPWSWSVVPWFEGESALEHALDDLATAADVLAGFLRALHQPAPDDAPRNPWRSVPLSDRTDIVNTHLSVVRDLIDTAAALAVWRRAVLAPAAPGPPVWIHGDLFPRNMLVRDGRISAVIDFGDLAAGDAATDLAIAWMMLPPAMRYPFIVAASSEATACDPFLPTRARGWALAFGLLDLANSAGDEAIRRLGKATIDGALDAFND